MNAIFHSLPWEKLAVLPIVRVPLVIKDFCSHFSAVFKRREQREYFEMLITGLSISDNKTIAGIHQQFVYGPTYESLHHFMSGSSWRAEKLGEERRKCIKKLMPGKYELTARTVEVLDTEPTNDDQPKAPTVVAGCEGERSRLLAKLGNRSESGSLQENKEHTLPTVVAIDATFAHHTSEEIYGVYWYWDYALRSYRLAQRLVLSTLVTPDKMIPIGWRLYHRGFLEEQKLYLEAMQPAPDADEETFAEYNGLVEKYEENKKEHKKQQELAGELVDECEALNLPIDGYVCDAALAMPELMNKIDAYKKAWVSKLPKNRLVQTAKGGFESVESFARSLPKDVFKPINVETRHGQKRTYFAFSKCVMVNGWSKLRIVISFDNAKLEGEPIYLVTNKTQWVQPSKTIQFYMMRDSIEHLIRDGKQELGLEDSQQRNEDGVRKYWELSFTAHMFLELGFAIPVLPGVPAVRLETIGQKSRVMEGVVLQGFVNLVQQWVLEGRDTKELIWQVMTKRLNRLAA